MTSRPLKTFTRATHSAGLFEDSDRRELVMNDGQHCRPLLIPPESGFSHSGISPKDLDALLLAREEGARPPSPRLSCYVGRSWSRLAPSGIPPPRERIDPDCPEGRHPISRSTHSAAYADLSARHTVHKQYIPSAFEVALAVLKVHRRRIRNGKRSSTPFLRRLMLKAENQSYWLDRGTGRTRIPVRGTEGGQLHFAALRLAPLDPRRLVVGPRIPHGCPGEGYRRPEEGGAEAVRAPRRDRLGHERGLGKGCTVPARCPPP